ncbi:MAG: HAMP domain-containing protein [Colwellia sp.]|nr:HAMP domain-containing protein [Colwellia sp.]
MISLTNIKIFFSSFTIKLFAWFWLIALISIASTRFISLQFSNDTVNKVVSQAPAHEEVRQLHNAARRIERSNLNTIDALRTIKYKRLKQLPFNLWFKSLDNPQRVRSLLPLTPQHQHVLTEYIQQHTFTEPQASIFSHTRLIGPLVIKLNNQPYQLFISRKLRRGGIGQIVQALPYWVRIAIPTLVSFLLCLLLAHSFSKPVRLIKKATTKLGQGDFSTRVNGVSQGNDELGQLALSFNKMAEQLQQHQSAQQRLLGDVSHELRSPMTRLQMALGLAQQDATTNEAREQYLQRCQREIERLDQMIEDVLTLSRLENTLQTVESERVNLTLLVQNIINDEQLIADKKSIQIKLTASQNITLMADQTLLVSAITNILNNAIKYSPTHSTIAISLTSNKRSVSLTITDHGNGVPEQALAQLFTPFYRVNLARDRNTGGTGLGLAIAKQAIVTHQGEIFAKNEAGKGLSVTMKIPHR